jgi:hypothetical protein
VDFKWLIRVAVALCAAACGSDLDGAPRRETSECDLYNACDEMGPFGDGDYGEYGNGDAEKPDEQPPPDDSDASSSSSSGGGERRRTVVPRRTSR